MIKSIIVTFVVLALIYSYSCQAKKTTTYFKSKFYTDSIYSIHLSEYRKHNIYLPKYFDSNNEYTIIYPTDGNNALNNSFIKTALDSLIDNQLIKPVIFVESHSNKAIVDSTSTITSDGKKVYFQFRNFEYVNRGIKRIKDSFLLYRFQNHMLYFKEELIPSIEKQFSKKNSFNSRIFYGYSNGAAFGVTLLNKYPSLIGTYICFSTLGSNIKNLGWKRDFHYPDLYIQYGMQENLDYQNESKDLELKYKELNSFCELKVFDGGHDINKWNIEFTKIISRILKPN